MTQQVQELIDKIKTEGVETAEKKSKEIEVQAKSQAQKTLDNAKKEADQLIIDAKEEIKKMQESTHMALKQASRDTLLSLRKEVENTLKKIISDEINESLSSDKLADILASIIKKSLDEKKGNGHIEVAVSEKDLQNLKGSFISKLQNQIKKEIRFESSEEIGSGFTISFDSGKSSFDFTDESLANYLSTFLNSQVSALIKETSKS